MDIQQPRALRLALAFASVSIFPLVNFTAGEPLNLHLSRNAGSSTVEVRVFGAAPTDSPIEARIHYSTDLKSWSPIGTKVRLIAGAGADDATVATGTGVAGFYRLSAQPTSFTSADASETLGYVSSFADEIEALGHFSRDDFVARYKPTVNYLPAIGFDPTQARYWDLFQGNAMKPGLPPSSEELSVLRSNGFVVSERLSFASFGDAYYEIFQRDLPVFISTDSILHAWHRSFDAVLQCVEQAHLKPKLTDLLGGMLEAVPAARAEYGDGVLKLSIDDAEFVLAVAERLLHIQSCCPPPPEPHLPADVARYNMALELIHSQESVIYQFFDGKQRGESVDFSQFKPRGHYVRTPALQQYFKAMMWLGRVDLRVAGNPEYASPRQLGAAIVLNDLLRRSGQRATWQAINRFITTFIGPSDSMDFDQLDALLTKGGLASAASIKSGAQLESFQATIESGALGVQAIQGHGFLGSAGKDQIKLPRSFTILGQRFTADSWTFNQVVMDRILDPGDESKNLVRRRLPYSLDVAFAVFANDQIVPELADNMANTNGVPFRDGFAYQRNLAAVRQVLDLRPSAAWTDTLYDRWLLSLRTLSAPTTGNEYPEAMRTRAWSMKTLNTQLASWTQLRHDTVLYVKQSETPPIFCEYPAGFVEPRPEFFTAMKSMANAATEALKSAGVPDNVNTEGLVNLPNPQMFFNNFAATCSTLADIASREQNQQPLSAAQTEFLDNTIENVHTYFGERQYNGWYPKLFFWGPNGNAVPYSISSGHSKPPDHDAVYPDYVVADVHTDGPSDPDNDPGAVLYEGTGRVNILYIAVDNGPDHMIFAGPVMSHYEFTMPLGSRMTDEDWKTALDSGSTPAPPPWTDSYLVRKR